MKAVSRAVSIPGWIIIALVIIWAGAGGKLSAGWQAAPFLVSMVFLGLPHGAVDHLVPYRLTTWPLTGRSMGLIVAGYLLLAAAYGFVWWVTPVGSVLFFILLTWFHWGQGELYALQRFLGIDKRGVLRQGLVVAVRGGLPMVVPFLAFPEIYVGFMNEMIGIIAPTWGAVAAPGSGAELRPWLLGMFGGLTLLYLLDGGVVALRRKEKAPWLIDAVEVGLLWLYFYTVEPILAVGLYFCVWHSVRHIARLLLVDPVGRERLENGRFWSALGKFMLDSLPLTIVSLLFLGGLYFFTSGSTTDLIDLTALYLVLISILTLPHTMVVCWMDYREGVWGNSAHALSVSLRESQAHTSQAVPPSPSHSRQPHS